jgi:hypothetical protein
VENHFQSLARIALFISANLSRKKKACTGSSLPFGKVADFTMLCEIWLLPLFGKMDEETLATNLKTN